MTEDILKLAMALGKVPAGEEDDLRKLCAQAERELAGRLRPGLTAGDCPEAFALAAAWTALADRQAGADLDGVSGFSAGDLTLRRSSGSDQALRRRAEAVLAPYLTDRGFLFQGVRG